MINEISHKKNVTYTHSSVLKFIFHTFVGSMLQKHDMAHKYNHSPEDEKFCINHA
jgi:hypothetical protein